MLCLLWVVAAAGEGWGLAGRGRLWAGLSAAAAQAHPPLTALSLRRTSRPAGCSALVFNPQLAAYIPCGKEWIKKKVGGWVLWLGWGWGAVGRLL